MRHPWAIRAALCVAAAIALPPVQAQADLDAAAKKEGRVAVYGTLESPIFEVIQVLFREKYGIPVDYFRLAANRLLDRVLTEVRAGKPQFDVVLSNLSPIRLMKKEGAFGQYVSPSYGAFPPATLDRDGILSPPYRMTVISIVYNTRLVTAADAPKTLLELAGEKWNGKVVMPDPNQHITTAVWLASLQPLMGSQYRPFVERLARDAVLVDSFDPAMQKIVTGEYPLGLTYVKYVYIMGRQGAPLDYVRLDPVLAERSYAAMAARPIHPSAARLFIDLFTSRLGLRTLAQAGEFVLAPGIFPPLQDAASLHIRPMQDLDEQQLRRWRSEFGTLFRKR